MEIQQRNTIEGQIEGVGTLNYGPPEPPPSQDCVDIIIRELLSRKIAPFQVCAQNQIMRESQDNQAESENIKDRILSYSRKEKSLAELSKRFLNHFEGTDRNMIALDQVTAELNVERRRIYDIINIMQSLGVVSKIRKNMYQWKGLSKAIQTIRMYADGQEPAKTERLKKQKSLEALATHFLRLFVNQAATVSLDEAADKILKDNSDPEFRKTKIRRLYDIVNVFKCMELVEKVSISGEKSGFKWKGISFLQRFIKNRMRNRGQKEYDSSSQQDKSVSEQDSDLESKQKRNFSFDFDQSNYSSFRNRRVNEIGSKAAGSERNFRCGEEGDSSLKLVQSSIQEERKLDTSESHCFEETRWAKPQTSEASYFQEIVRNLGGNQMTAQNLHRKFTQIIWPQKAISK